MYRILRADRMYRPIALAGKTAFLERTEAPLFDPIAGWWKMQDYNSRKRMVDHRHLPTQNGLSMRPEKRLQAGYERPFGRSERHVSRSSLGISRQTPVGRPVIATLVFPPRSRELVAVIEPAPDFVTRRIAPQSIVDADPTEIVVTFCCGVPDIKPTGALELPVIVRVPVTVVVTP